MSGCSCDGDGGGNRAEWGAVCRVERGDVDLESWRVLVRGTKRTTRWRMVPLVTHAQRSLIEYAMAHAGGQGAMLFLPWQNARRDLALACDKVGIEPCSPNDLRRTCATWLRQDGAPPDLIAHRDGSRRYPHGRARLRPIAAAGPGAAARGDAQILSGSL